MKTVSVLVFFFLLPLLAEARSTNRTVCKGSFTCGELDLKFPFFSMTMPSRCGLFKMNCNISEIQLEENGKWYKVKSVSQANTLTITDPRLNQSLEAGNCRDLSIFSLPNSPWLTLTTLYKCNNSSRKDGFSYANCGGGSSSYYKQEDGLDVSGCSVIKTPESWVVPKHTNQLYVNATFSLHIELPRGCFGCQRRDGECKKIKDKFRCVGATTEQKNSQERMIKLGLGISIGLSVFIVGIGIWLHKFTRKTNRRKKLFKRNGGFLLQQQLASREGYVDKTIIFSSKELEKATDCFSLNRVLGRGGQGTVYKGLLDDGRIVAVKKSMVVDEDKLEEFINEVVILSQINHRNIVNILGCCLETELPILVYEFIPNGNLFELLHKCDDQTLATWELRLRIAIDIAGALSYLHSAAASPIYHRDIKSTNIMLDENYRAKVSDFGTSRSITIDHTHLTTLVSGTVGYLDPEYFQSSQFTDKSDVYSFGVVLVELITGEKPVSFLRPQENRTLATYFNLAMKENRFSDIIDSRIKDDCKLEQLMLMAKIAQMCLKLKGKKRPNMREVLVQLERICPSHGDLQADVSTVANDKEGEAAKVSTSIDAVNIDVTTFASTSQYNANTALWYDVQSLVPRQTW